LFVAWRVKKSAVVAETPTHKQGHNLLMKTELRRRRMKLGPTDTVVAESPLKLPQDSVAPSSLPTTQFMKRSSFYSEKPPRNSLKYTKLEERMTQKLLSPPSQKFESTYVAGSWLTSPRRITPKALFGSLLSSSPSGKTSANMRRKLDLKSPIKNVHLSTSLDFKSPVKVPGLSTSSTVVATPPRPAASSLSQLGLDSPSRNTWSRTSAEKQRSQSETVVTRQPDKITSPSSLGCYRNRINSPSSAVETSPDFRRFLSGPQSSLSRSSGSKSLKLNDVANQTPACSSKPVTSSSCLLCADSTECHVNSADTCSRLLSSDADAVMKNTEEWRSCVRESVESYASDKQSSKKKRISVGSTFRSLSQSSQPSGQSADGTEDICGSDFRDSRISVVRKSDAYGAENILSHKRKKPDEGVVGKCSARKRPCRQLHVESSSPPSDKHESEDATAFTTLSFGCDTELHDETRDCARPTVVGQTEKLHSDILWHLGSSGVESETSSNDADLMIARKYHLGRKRSSGFQSLGHISETECCPSPVFPTISNEPVADDVPAENNRPAVTDSISESPVFGARKTQSFAESPCFSLSGSGRKRTPVPGCSKSFSPDVSQCSITHLLTSPLLDVGDTQKKSSRSRSSTRRCLDQQMNQSGRRLFVGQHSSTKLTDDDN